MRPLKIQTWLNTIIEPHFLRKNVLDIYYNVYIFNLKTYANFYKCIFISARDIYPGVPSGLWDGGGDPLFKNPEALSDAFLDDILKNGFHFHITLFKTDQGYKIENGRHRLFAVRLLKERGLWPMNRGLLAATDERIAARPTFSNQVFYVPLAASGEAKRGMKYVYSSSLSTKDKPAVIRDNFIVKPVSERDVGAPDPAHQHVLICTALLRESLRAYKLKTGSAYPAHEAINNKEAWENWKPEDFTNLLREF